jgi:hypothetical protein
MRKLSREDLEKRLKADEKLFSDIDFAGDNLSSLNLSYVEFRN